MARMNFYAPRDTSMVMQGGGNVKRGLYNSVYVMYNRRNLKCRSSIGAGAVRCDDKNLPQPSKG